MAAPAAAQNRSGELLPGLEVRTIRFEGLPTIERLRQIAVPVGAVLPFGRLTVDVSAAWASTRMQRVDGTHHLVNTFTDTQVRGTYVFGRDALAATLMLNLPTGPRSASARDYSVFGAISPGLLGFPIASFANGFSVTSGLAGAVEAGDWSFGLAGSVRIGSEFTPYSDLNGPITYKPGVEGRIRAGAEGLIGESRLTIGGTYSTFGDDEVGQGTVRSAYRPGVRWLGEANLVAPVGSSQLSFSAWHFRRNPGDTTGASARNRENLTGGEAVFSVPVSPSLRLEPLFAGRWSKPQAGSARILGAGGSVRFMPGVSSSVTATLRIDDGRIVDPSGNAFDLKGLYFSVFIRTSL